jgi:sugar phosphate isomerase/epimerase
MIYISSSCVKTRNIREAVSTLAKSGFKNIELSGGTKYYEGFLNDLLFLQEKYNLNYQLHNYFPPPQKSFYLNLASLDNKIFNQSIELYKNAIFLSKQLKSYRYGLHAGNLIDIRPNEAGKKILKRSLSNKDKALSRIAEGWKIISDEADGEINLYIENNVLSSTNNITYKDNNPFLLTSFASYQELKEHINFNLLLDVAHLKVSAKSLNLNLNDELKKLVPLTDYIHLSDNDGLHDQNKVFKNDSEMLKMLKKHDLSQKTFTLETYSEMEKIKDNFNLFSEFINVSRF